MKILLTGGAGFIGSNVGRALLERGDELCIIDDFNDYYSPEIKEHNLASLVETGKVELVRGDICDGEAIDRIDWKSIDKVIHLAARAGVRPSLEEPKLYWRTNLEGTLNLLEQARIHNIKTFVSASSSSVYGDSAQPPFREDDPAPNPISPYAATKRAGELMCFTYHHLYDIDISCLRYFTVYGPGQRPEMAIHKFCRRITEGRSIPMFGDGSTRRDYTYIDDIVQGTLAALDRCSGYHIYNLGESATTTLSELIRMIGEALGEEPIIECQPMQPGDVKQTYADISKAKRELDYQPGIDMETGISRFVTWFRKMRGDGIL